MTLDEYLKLADDRWDDDLDVPILIKLVRCYEKHLAAHFPGMREEIAAILKEAEG